MLKEFSFQDVLKIKEFQSLNMFDLLKREMDSKISPILFKLGGDVDKGIKIQACKHRTISHQEVVGYRYICLERSDKDWLANRNCSMSARIHSQKDKWLAADMIQACSEGMGESGWINMCVGAIGSDGATKVKKKDVMDTYEKDRSVMLALRNIQKDIRGYLHPDEDMFEYEVVDESMLNLS